MMNQKHKSNENSFSGEKPNRRYPAGKLKVIIAATFTTVTFATVNSTSVFAHEFLTEVLTQQNLSATVTFVPVENYQLSKSEILDLLAVNAKVDYYKTRSGRLAAVQRNLEDECEASGSKTCGQFDHFSMARSAAIITCYLLGQQQIDLYPNGLFPLYIAPSSFVNLGEATSNHHIDYNLEHGLDFDCGYMSTELNYDQNA